MKAYALLFLATTAVAQTVYPSRHALSPPLKTLNTQPATARGFDQPRANVYHVGAQEAVQTAAPTALPVTILSSFDGIGFSGNVPSDANAAVGLTQVVEWVNTEFQVFDKKGNSLLGPISGFALWQNPPIPGCAGPVGYDPVVRYDQLADRWVFSFSAGTMLCVAVSQTADATGQFAVYGFQVYDYPGPTAITWDYQKLAVWPDAYYVTVNNPGGHDVCALDRTAMLAGALATSQCFISNNFGNAGWPSLASDLDGKTFLAGTPNRIVVASEVAPELLLWDFHPDFQNPSNATFTPVPALQVASYSATCGICIQQLDTSQTLVPGEEEVMQRFAYRVLNGVGTWTLTHTVDGPGTTAVRWYQIGSTLQQGTYAPDLSARFMGSAAMDRFGNLALGYSVSDASMHPSIRITGRQASDPANTLDGELSVLVGGGSNTTGNRWGDYSSMVLDPVDDCTFWYTSQYLPSDGFAWKTHIVSFQFPTCGKKKAPGPPDFTIGAMPSSQTITAGQSAAYNVTVSDLNGFNGTVTFSCGPLPATTACSFSPTPTGALLSIQTTAATTAMLWTTLPLVGIGLTRTKIRKRIFIRVGVVLLLALLLAACGSSGASGFGSGGFGGGGFSTPGTPAGSYQVTITGTSGTLSHSVMVGLTVK